MKLRRLFFTQKHRPGLTFVEMLMSLFVLGIIVVVVGNLLIGINTFARDEEDRVLVGEEAARLLGPVDRFLRQGKNVLPSVTINSTLYTTGATTLVFSLPSIMVDGTLSPTDIDSAVLTLDTSLADNNRLHMIIHPHANSTRPAEDGFVTSHIRDIYFRYNTASATLATAVTVTAVIERSVARRNYAQTALVYATLRNHP